MKLIENLGMIKPTTKSLYKKTMGIYLCQCGREFRATTSAVRIGRITRCSKCPSIGVQTCPIDTMRRIMTTHAETYTYSQFVYWKRHEPAIVTCRVHGPFPQNIGNHIQGAGCPTCGQNKRSIVTRQNRQDPAVLYYVYFPELNMWKVGVTVQTIETRFSGEVYGYTILWRREYETAEMAYYVESKILEEFHNLRYRGPALLVRKGSTELLLENILNHIILSVETIENTLKRS